MKPAPAVLNLCDAKTGKVLQSIPLDDETLDLLAMLAPTPAIAGAGLSQDVAILRVLEHLIHSMADGVRRPGSWERQVVCQLFGEIG